MENNYIVYMHKNKMNGKVYIGTTKQSFKKRCGNNGSQYKSQPFYKSIKKYGWNNFEHIILFENLTKKDAEEKEIETIKYYKSNREEYGYNINKGGFGKEKKEGNVIFNISMPIELKEELKIQAKKLGLSLTTYIRFKLNEMVKSEGDSK